MEDVLAVYTRPHDPDRVLVCLDETSKQLIAETRVPIPMKPGRAARIDYEYERNGTANLFMLFAPLEGWRHVEVTDRHTAVDYARVLKDLADRHFPHVNTIVLVQDNLNIHSRASLYEAFPAPEARRLVERFEWHYTPKHGSWLDLAESELGFYPPNASTAVSPTNRPSSRKPPPGNTTAMLITPRQTGNSQPKLLVSNSSTSTLQSDRIRRLGPPRSASRLPNTCVGSWPTISAEDEPSPIFRSCSISAPPANRPTLRATRTR
jgi:hypothetical protein